MFYTGPVIFFTGSIINLMLFYETIFSNRGKISEIYLSAFKLTSIRTRDVSIVYPVAAQTIAPRTGPLC